MSAKKTSAENVSLLEVLKQRFENNMHRHKSMKWDEAEKLISKKKSTLVSIGKMESTGGEPDVVILGKSKDPFIMDCSRESPKERRSLCYDAAALSSRKEHKPHHSAEGLATEMGVELIDEDTYRELQAVEEFDLKTSSWLKTPHEIRKLGGAIFGDRRFDHVFVYHNGAESYYGSRGFRAMIRL